MFILESDHRVNFDTNNFILDISMSTSYLTITVYITKWLDLLMTLEFTGRG